MANSSLQSSAIASASDMKVHLRNLLDSKEKQLQQAGTLGQRVLSQQMELEDRIRQLEIDTDNSEDTTISPEARARYQELEETLKSWDAENGKLSSAFGDSEHGVDHKDPSSNPLADLLQEPAEASAGTAAAQSRRAKNASHRANDVEFAFEIGSGLLTEVRRLQSLLGERDKSIQDMKEEKDDLEKSVESLRMALRQQESSADKFKEENWNLEVTLQELRTQLSDSQVSTQRFESEHKRLTKLLSTSRDTADQHKNESERLQNLIDEVRAKHETDVAQARKNAAGLSRDKSDLQQTIDSLKTTMTKMKHEHDIDEAKAKLATEAIKSAMEEVKVKHESDAAQFKQTIDSTNTVNEELRAKLGADAAQAQRAIDNMNTSMEEMKADYETDLTQAHERATRLARETLDLQETIDTLKTSMKAVATEMKAEVARAHERTAELQKTIDDMKIDVPHAGRPRFWFRIKIFSRRNQTLKQPSPVLAG